MPTIERIERRLGTHAPRRVGAEGRAQAAVAVVLRDTASGPDLLFIERAQHEADPWSGHMAFPGGRVDPGDRDSREAAERETLEEVGLSLESARYLGRLDDLEGRHAGPRFRMVISAHVFHHPDPAPLVPNHEVEEVIWFPVAALLDPERRVHLDAPSGERFPGILVGEPQRHVVWGLTYRFVERLLEIIGEPIPSRWMGVG